MSYSTIDSSVTSQMNDENDGENPIVELRVPALSAEVPESRRNYLVGCDTWTVEFVFTCMSRLKCNQYYAGFYRRPWPTYMMLTRPLSKKTRNASDCDLNLTYSSRINRRPRSPSEPEPRRTRSKFDDRLQKYDGRFRFSKMAVGRHIGCDQPEVAPFDPPTQKNLESDRKWIRDPVQIHGNLKFARTRRRS